MRFLAVDEFEYVMNFKILQKVASDGYIDGLNRDAKVGLTLLIDSHGKCNSTFIRTAPFRLT